MMLDFYGLKLVDKKKGLRYPVDIHTLIIYAVLYSVLL